MRLLIIRHIDKKGTNGGDAYSKSIAIVLQRAFPEAAIDVVCGVTNDSAFRKRLRAVAAFARFLMSGEASKSFYFQTRRCLRELKNLLAENIYDLVMIDHVEMLWVLNYTLGASRHLCVSHNVESLLYAAFLRRKRIPAGFRFLFEKDRMAYERFEFSGIARVGKLISISDHDAELYRRHCPETEVSVIPPLFAYPPYLYEPRTCETIRLGVLANIHWWPNQSGMEWFFRNVAPHIAVLHEIHCFGLGSERFAGRANCRSHGFVDSIAAVWPQCDLMMIPMHEGGGVNIKLAESLYNRMPVMCTSFATRGLLEPLKTGGSCFISDDGSAWADHINAIVSQSVLLLPQNEAVSSCFRPENYVDRLRRLLA